MEFGVLGPLSVTTADGEVDIGGARQRRLLAALLAHAGQIVPLDRLTDMVFEGDPPRGAATTMRSYVARLRRGGPLAVVGPPYNTNCCTAQSRHLSLGRTSATDWRC